jgi:hypothetical protein
LFRYCCAIHNVFKPFILQTLASTTLFLGA